MIERRFSSAPTIARNTSALKVTTTGTTLVGYAAVYNSVAQIGKYFLEKIAPGAFRDAIRTSDTRALLNHDRNFLLGRTASGTLRLLEDQKGLRYEIQINPYDSAARDVVARIKRGDLNASSFGFTVSEEDEHWAFDKTHVLPLRTILRVQQLFDISPVTFPAYSETSVSARAKAL